MAHLAPGGPGLVLQLPLLDPPGLLLVLLEHHVLVLVELDGLLVQLVHRVHHGPQLCLQRVRRPQVQELRAAHVQRQLLLENHW